MDMKSTYLHVSENSVFLTPPFSDECPCPNKAISRIDSCIDKPIFSLAEEDDLEDVNCKIDILNNLYKQSLVNTVCYKIFEHLSDMDLVRASHVSKSWKMITRYMDIKAGRRVSRFLKKKNKIYLLNKENVSSQKKSFLIPLDRTPLSSAPDNVPLLPNIPKELSMSETDNIFITPVSSSSKELYKQCPVCQSPARTTYRQTGHCTKCNQDFCLHCFYTKSNHSPTCQVIGGSGVTCSPRKLSTSSRRYSMSSKENRSRLKRL